MTHPFARGRAEPEKQKPFRGGGRARVSAHASRESDARQPFRRDLSRSGRGIRVAEVKRTVIMASISGLCLRCSRYRPRLAPALELKGVHARP
jgi:hypothetical protein